MLRGVHITAGAPASPPAVPQASRLRLALLALLLASCATAPPPPPPAFTLPPPPPHALTFVLIEDDDGTVLASNNADKLMLPASNRKLFASATIANCLGLDTRLATEVWRDGEDLVLVGDGDPSLGSWRYERSEDFNQLADLLRARGTRTVRDVIADVSRFDRVTIPGSWKNGNLGADYAAPVDAITWGESEIANDRSVPDPALWAAQSMRDALLSRGIAVTGTPRVVTERRVWQEKITEIRSPFVAQLLTTVLKNSHNLYAEMLLKRASNGTYPASFALERAFLTNEAHVPPDEFNFVDGSGLAPDDLVSPRAIIAMLRWMNDPSRRGFWWSVMATPGEGGTLHYRIVPLADRVRGKTGTINGVNALSGIIAMPDGRFRYFALAVNHNIAGGGEEWLDEVVTRAAAAPQRRSNTAP